MSGTESPHRGPHPKALALGALLPALLVVAAAIGCYVFSAPTYRGPLSDHFNGSTFHNVAPTVYTLADSLRWRLDPHPGYWRPFTYASPGSRPRTRVDDGRIRVTVVNHSTVLVQMDGLNILTDPVWSDRIGPLPWLGPKRHRPPGIRFEDLPPIDAVLISSNHHDHLDLPTLERLAQSPMPRFVVPLGNAPLLEGAGISNAVELDWWEAIPLSDRVRVTAVPAQHLSMRGLLDRDKTLWAGFVLEGPSGPVYFAGDTGYGPHFAEIASRLGPPRLALLPIGGYLPRELMKPMHMSPEDALLAQRDLGAETSVAIHFGTFRLGDDAEAEPVEELERALARMDGLKPRFWALSFGEAREIPSDD
jgi:L-ascorbate metabolism protein UlaG (beta-lactamase superfamily)